MNKKIVVLTVPNNQKMDFVSELQNRTNSVGLLVVQSTKKKRSSARILNLMKKAGFWNLPKEVLSFLGQRRGSSRKTLSVLKKWTPLSTKESLSEIETIHTENVNGEDVSAKIKEIRPDILVIWGGMIVSKELLETAKISLNLHQGLCPFYRGSNGNLHAILAGERRKIGITIHYATPKVDAGKIISTIKGNGDLGKEEFFKDLNDRGTKEYLEIISSILNGNIPEGDEQDLSLGHNYLLKEWTYEKQQKLTKVLNSWK